MNEETVAHMAVSLRWSRAERKKERKERGNGKMQAREERGRRESGIAASLKSAGVRKREGKEAPKHGGRARERRRGREGVMEAGRAGDGGSVRESESSREHGNTRAAREAICSHGLLYRLASLASSL